MSGTDSSEAEPLARRVLRDLSEHEKTRSAAPAGPSGPPPVFSRFEILEAVGQGATATVYRARDRVLGRIVAVKVLRDGPALGDAARERFRREAQAAAGLAHPNVVTVFDAGEEDGRPFLVMELVEGRPLSEALRVGDRLRLLPLLEKAARGVAAAHARGIVHRDLKPANLLITAEGEPKVGDFGLAHVLDTRSELTRTGTALGTPVYMAPEQVEGRPGEISPRTDVYALGAILYEILAGRPPHAGETLADLYRRILREDPLPPGAFAAGVPPDAATIALKALEKEPGRRYADAADFADDLKRHLDGEPVRARPVGPLGRLARRIRRNPLGAALLAAAAAALLLAAGLAVRQVRLGRELAEMTQRLPDPRPWTPVFDGASSACFMNPRPRGWALEGGEFVASGGEIEAIQTERVFEDGEVRIRFLCEDLNFLGFNIRLGVRAGYEAQWDRKAVEGMAGAERILVFRLRGGEVTATLDGAPQPLTVHHRNPRGTLHVGAVNGRLRIRAIDYREPAP